MAADAIFSSFRRPEAPVIPGADQSESISSAPETLAPPQSEPTPPVEPAPAIDLSQPPSEAAATFKMAGLRSIRVECDQLGLLHPAVVYLFARVSGSQMQLLDAEFSGIYRPFEFTPPPWSGLSHDIAAEPAAGIGAGTRLLTQRGEIEVEHLVPGDSVMTLNHPTLLPILWIGRCSTPSLVRIATGALGPNVPQRTLVVGSQQLIFQTNDAKPALSFVDGRSIVSFSVDGLDLFQIDVGRSEVMFADGLPIGTGKRASVLR